MTGGAAPLVVLFDVDGTLIDAGGAGRHAIERALLRVYGTTGPIDDLPFDGLTDPAIARSLLSAAGVAEARIERDMVALWDAYVECLETRLREAPGSVRALDGTVELLDALAGRGALVGLLTGNIERGAVRKLAACGLHRRFRFGAYGSDDEDRDRLPDVALRRAAAHHPGVNPARAWIIGDTPRDVRCARAGGLRALGVATGRYSRRALRDCGADYAADSLLDTARILEALESGAASRLGTRPDTRSTARPETR